MQDPSVVPFNIFHTVVTLDSSLLKPFLSLCKGFRSHLLWELREKVTPALNNFKKVYRDFFVLENDYIWQSEIAYGKQIGARVDQVLRFKVR